MTTPTPEPTPEQRARMRAAVLAELHVLRAEALADGAGREHLAAIIENRIRRVSGR